MTANTAVLQARVVGLLRDLRVPIPPHELSNPSLVRERLRSAVHLGMDVALVVDLVDALATWEQARGAVVQPGHPARQ